MEAEVLTLNDVITFVAGNWGSIPWWMVVLPVTPWILGTIAAATPTKIDDKAVGILVPILNGVLKVVNVGALNVGKAKNADVFETELEQIKTKVQDTMRSELSDFVSSTLKQNKES